MVSTKRDGARDTPCQAGLAGRQVRPEIYGDLRHLVSEREAEQRQQDEDGEEVGNGILL